jgi:hypothetical protein
VKTYSNRGNCIRAARVALGKSAKPDIDFKLTKHDDGTFSFTAIDGKAGGKRERKPLTKEQTMAVALQPKMAGILDYIANSANGRTVADLQRHLGGVESHTARGCVARLRMAGFAINVGKVFRVVSYQISKAAVAARRRQIEAALTKSEKAAA